MVEQYARPLMSLQPNSRATYFLITPFTIMYDEALFFGTKLRNSTIQVIVTALEKSLRMHASAPSTAAAPACGELPPHLPLQGFSMVLAVCTCALAWPVQLRGRGPKMNPTAAEYRYLRACMQADSEPNNTFLAELNKGGHLMPNVWCKDLSPANPLPQNESKIPLFVVDIQPQLLAATQNFANFCRTYRYQDIVRGCPFTLLPVLWPACKGSMGKCLWCTGHGVKGNVH